MACRAVGSRLKTPRVQSEGEACQRLYASFVLSQIVRRRPNMAKKATVPSKTGRPRAGVGGGRVRDYPQLNVRVPPRLRTQLAEVRRATGWSHLQVITRAVACLKRELAKRKMTK